MGYKERRRGGDVRRIDDHYTNKGIPTKGGTPRQTIPPIIWVFV